MQSEQQQRIMGYFIEEAKDHLNTIEQGLLNLQGTIEDPDLVSEVFRAAHSVKGGAAMLGLDSIQKTAHRLEDYFKVLKECPVQVDQKLETLFLRVFDTLQDLLEQLQGPFGLTDDSAVQIMGDVEPVLLELNSHLSTLVEQSGNIPPDEVDLSRQAAQVAPESQSKPAEPVAASIKAEDSALKLYFQSEVPAQLRTMLQLFKQPDNAAVRQQLQDICNEFEQAGESFDLPSSWHELTHCAKRAIANSDNDFRSLAPALIKDLKQAQDLVLSGRASDIAPSPSLQELQPITDVFDEEADVLTPDSSSSEWFNDVADVGDLGLNDTSNTPDEADHLFGDAGENLSNTDLETTHDGLGMNGNATGDISGEELFDDVFGSLSDNASSSLSDTDESLDLDLDIDDSDDLNLGFDDLDSEPSDLSLSREGPQVGTAELNSLADLFESEGSESNMDWQEEVIDDASDLLVEGLALEASDDFSDLLFDERSDTSAEQQDAEDISALLNGAEKSTAASAQPDIAQEDEFADLFEVGTPDESSHVSNAASDGLEELGDFFDSMDDPEKSQQEPNTPVNSESELEGLEALGGSPLDLPENTVNDFGTDETGSAEDFDSLFDIDEATDVSVAELPHRSSENSSELGLEDDFLGEMVATEETESDVLDADSVDGFFNELDTVKPDPEGDNQFNSDDSPDNTFGSVFDDAANDLFGTSEEISATEISATENVALTNDNTTDNEFEDLLGDLTGDDQSVTDETDPSADNLEIDMYASNTSAGSDESLDIPSIENDSSNVNEAVNEAFDSVSNGNEDSIAEPNHALNAEIPNTPDTSGASLDDFWGSEASDESDDESEMVTATEENREFESIDFSDADDFDAENLDDDALNLFPDENTASEDDIDALFLEDENLADDDSISSDVTEELPEGLLNEISEELVDSSASLDMGNDSDDVVGDVSSLDNELDFDFGFNSDDAPSEATDADATSEQDQLSFEVDDTSSAEDVDLSDFDMSDIFGDSNSVESDSLDGSENLANLDLEAELSSGFDDVQATSDSSRDTELSLDATDFDFEVDTAPESDASEEDVSNESVSAEDLDLSLDLDTDLDDVFENELTDTDISFESLDTDVSSELQSDPDIFGDETHEHGYQAEEIDIHDDGSDDFLSLEPEPVASSEGDHSVDEAVLFPAGESDSDADMDEASIDLSDDLSESLGNSDPFGNTDAEVAGFDELESFLDGNMPETSDVNVDEGIEASSSDLESFDDLEAFLSNADELEGIGSGYEENVEEPSITGTGDEFDDLEALLDESANGAIAISIDDQNFSGVDAAESGDDDFSDLEKLLEDADHNLGGSPTAKAARGPSPVPSRRTPSRRSGGGLTDQTMRVSVKNLDNLNNLVGELVVNRNSLEQSQERLRQFLDNLLYQVQQLSDVGQRMRDLYERSLLESSLLTSRRGNHLVVAQAAGGNAAASDATHATGESFDALEMDRFTGFHTLSQEMIELIVRVREAASDIDFVIDESDQTTRMFRQVTTQLQEGLTRSRMVPFAQAASRLPRAVRDISIKCGKQAELIVEGKDTLIDKMILEQLYDPMTHLVNNAITHGIETPEERIALNKVPIGKITIRVFHQGNQTIIAVTDDGAGIDPEKVKGKALQRGLISPEEAQSMSRLDIYDLIFHHGFSTRDQADDFAGRGVGMDVVRTSLSEIRGVVSIDSAVGQGTTFTIRLPLTLSISKALLCVSNRARIAFPMDGVEDMLDVPRDRIQTDAEGQSCILWRDIMLPFRPLTELLKYNRVMGRGSVYGGNQEEDVVSVVVLRSAGNYLALQVDQVLGEQEIVIKQLEAPVPKPAGIAGATVLGDGRIMPIADVLELIDLSMGRIRREAGSSLWDQEAARIATTEASDAKSEPTVLIVDDSITVRELLSMTFNKVGYRVEQARDGQEAWEKLKSGLPCELVFCDIEMPRMDGLELLSRLQKDANLKNLPIAMLTSRGADRHRQMAIQLGAKGYFTKPYLEEALLDAAQRMLNGEVLVSNH